MKSLRIFKKAVKQSDKTIKSARRSAAELDKLTANFVKASTKSLASKK